MDDAAKAADEIRAYYKAHVTIAALAREAGVSPQLVSMVLSGKKKYPSQRIIDAARKLGIVT